MLGQVMGKHEVGMTGRVRWSNCGYRYSARGKIVKVNAKTIKVAIDEAVPTGCGEYEIGFVVTLPTHNTLADWFLPDLNS
jgi:hypothetical protein